MGQDRTGQDRGFAAASERRRQLAARGRASRVGGCGPSGSLPPPVRATVLQGAAAGAWFEGWSRVYPSNKAHFSLERLSSALVVKIVGHG